MENTNTNTEHTHTLTFSLRDWRQGCDLLRRIGWNDNELMTDHFELTLTAAWQEAEIRTELNALDIEFTLQRI
tara:strand:- start:192 stop:410 length:219 start_codon:yes stop_codon:yes gene_type:complete